jgi:hypothetical protein
MGAMVDLLPLLPSLAGGSQSVAPTPLIARDPRQLRAALDKLRQDQSVATATSRLRAFLQSFQQDRTVQAGPELDDAIEALLTAEEAAAKRPQKNIALAGEMVAAAQEQEPSTIALVREINELTVDRHADYLEVLRDLRISLMARRAELEPPPDGPVLSTPAEVRSFFQKLHAE